MRRGLRFALHTKVGQLVYIINVLVEENGSLFVKVYAFVWFFVK
jgi:hypothetical protein